MWISTLKLEVQYFQIKKTTLDKKYLLHKRKSQLSWYWLHVRARPVFSSERLHMHSNNYRNEYYRLEFLSFAQSITADKKNIIVYKLDCKKM